MEPQQEETSASPGETSTVTSTNSTHDEGNSSTPRPTDSTDADADNTMSSPCATTDTGRKPLYEVGDVIQEKIKPIFKRLICNVKGKYCEYCFKKSDSLKACTSCALAYYCNRTCQVKDWKKIHKIECGSKLFREVGTQERKVVEAGPGKKKFGATILLSFYAFIKLNPGILDIKKQRYDGTYLTLRELLEKYKNFQVVTNPEFLTIKEIRIFAEKLKAEDKSIGFKYIRQLYFTFAMNMFMMHGINDEPIGYSIDLELANLENSCVPNALYFEHPATGLITIKAVGTIYDNDKVTVRWDAYGFEKDTDSRKEDLQKKFGIDCQCELCVSKAYFDYTRFSTLLDKYKRLGDVHSIQVWPEFWEVHSELRKMMSFLFNPLDVKIVELLWLTSLYAMKTRIRGYLVERLLKECEGYITKLYGTDHHYWEEFRLRVMHYETSNLLDALDLETDTDTETDTAELPESVSYIEEIKEREDNAVKFCSRDPNPLSESAAESKQD